MLFEQLQFLSKEHDWEPGINNITENRPIYFPKGGTY